MSTGGLKQCEWSPCFSLFAVYQNCSEKYHPDNRVEEEIDARQPEVATGSEPLEETEHIEISEAMEVGIELEDAKCNAGEEDESTQDPEYIWRKQIGEDDQSTQDPEYTWRKQIKMHLEETDGNPVNPEGAELNPKALDEGTETEVPNTLEEDNALKPEDTEILHGDGIAVAAPTLDSGSVEVFDDPPDPDQESLAGAKVGQDTPADNAEMGDPTDKLADADTDVTPSISEDAELNLKTQGEGRETEDVKEGPEVPKILDPLEEDNPLKLGDTEDLQDDDKPVAALTLDSESTQVLGDPQDPKSPEGDKVGQDTPANNTEMVDPTDKPLAPETMDPLEEDNPLKPDDTESLQDYDIPIAAPTLDSESIQVFDNPPDLDPESSEGVKVEQATLADNTEMEDSTDKPLEERDGLPLNPEDAELNPKTLEERTETEDMNDGPEVAPEVTDPPKEDNPLKTEDSESLQDDDIPVAAPTLDSESVEVIDDPPDPDPESPEGAKVEQDTPADNTEIGDSQDKQSDAGEAS